ncbi:MAG: hypothetical protein HYT62_05135 [Candidatus Yanofskybacteria bacterium]|nr:hypothetical protein [Candidatus Yanofskybacteria bacterium]
MHVRVTRSFNGVTSADGKSVTPDGERFSIPIQDGHQSKPGTRGRFWEARMTKSMRPSRTVAIPYSDNA